ncbi:ATP-binding cassette sub-family C member 4-like [Physella acuta]|uniref:ATP-binding cassette sub-family C member 4-like n=1 Tax=Physella acuta TaxID=109671 RepID=UPI0027DD75B2|nr:ATP-binding cassette sub-family C member 4-like [Physella acuta]
MADHSLRSCPYDQANIFSKITFWWMNALFKMGFKNELSSMNICEVSKEDESSRLESRLERYWKEEVQKFSEGGKASLFRAILKAFKWQWLLPGVLVLIFESVKLVQPYLIGLLVTYFNSEVDAVSESTAYGVGACLGISALIQVCVNPTYFFIMQHVALRMKVAVGALIYRKVLSLSTEAFHQTSSGQIVNHLSTDLEKFNSSIDLLHYLWVSPLSIIIVMYLMYQQVGIVCFWGLAVVAVIVPLQAGLSSVFGKIRQKIGSYSDKRIQLMSEIIMAMRMIKMQCWEQPFQNLVSKIRRQEIYLYHVGATLKTFTRGFQDISPRLMMMAILVAAYHTSGQSVTPSMVFTIVGWLEVVRLTGFYFIYFSVENISQLFMSMFRVQTFLLLDEEKEQIKDLNLHRSVSYRNEPHSDWAVDIDHMTARWPVVYTEGKRRFQKKRERTSTSSTKSLLHESDVDHAFSLKYISLSIKKGELLAVVGVVGSGKSSLLLALIGELPYEIGQIAINGRVSYCGQTNWVFSGTVRENILFGHSFNPKYYQLVINACGLTRDLELLPKGDQTFVGERGLQLSGGQRARLSLARSVYHNADVFLFDDPLSAVDASVGQHIFQRCILDLLREKTVVLVTHQLQYLKKADRIAVMREGSIHDIGTYDELKARGMDMKALTSSDEHPKHATEAALEAEEEAKLLLLESKTLRLPDENKDTEEEVLSGTVGIKVYWSYFCAGYGPVLLPLLLPLWFAGPALFCFSDWMLAEWVGTTSKNHNPPGLEYNKSLVTVPLTLDLTSSTKSPQGEGGLPVTMTWYIIGLVTSCVAYILYAAVYLQMTVVASRRLHDRMLNRVMNSVSRFFDTHSVGQILNRFSRDLGFVDDSVSMLGYLVSMKTTQFLGFFIVTVIVNPWLTIAVVPVMVLIVLTRMYALRTLRQVKRLEAKARSPVYAHVSDTILGLETIRALGKKEQFLSEFDEHQNKHTSAWFLHLSSYRWMSVRTMMTVVVYMNLIIFVSLALKDSLNGNLLALSLIYCIAMAEPFEWYMRISADLETYMTSVERVLQYSELDQEPHKNSDKPPSPDWPVIGAITFTSLSLKYSPDSPYILKKIDCYIKGKEKVGIVGRTGSGKSSLITSLFRLAHPSGTIYIDGVDASKLGLHELRSKISVIPQDPVLFSQTLRWNLDPLEEFSDERLWHALEQVQLKRKVEQMPGKLYTDLQEGGANLSVGQRQLICLARALLKYNKILILDEATANVDPETDDIIQRTIRAKFRDSTVLTIAHRLYTVMDCDRIMVLEDGELKEFDSPYNLLQKSDGHFSRLVLSLGKNQAKQLQALAELSQHQRTSACLQLQRAMLLANEQLAQSTEDLSAGRAALRWNRFTHSQDSLDKAQLESIVEKDKKSIAPSQRIIRRRSPGRTKRTIEEEEELMSYDTPPKTRQVFGTKKQNDKRNTDSFSSHSKESSWGQSEETASTTLDQSKKDLTARLQQDKQKSGPDQKVPFETDVDFEPARRRSGGNTHSRQMQGSPTSKTAPQKLSDSPKPLANKAISSPKYNNSATSPPSSRVITGPYVPLAKDEKEEFV